MNEYVNKYRYDSHKAEKYFAKKLAFTLGPVELNLMIEQKKAIPLDVRKKEDFDAGHIATAVSIPKAELRDRISELSKENLYVVYCYNQQCHLGAAAALILAQNDIPVMELEGGIKVWKEDFNFPLIS